MTHKVNFSPKSLGGLFRAHKTQSRSPDLLGTIKLQLTDLRQLFAQAVSGSETVEGKIAGWLNEKDGVKFISIQLSPKYRPPTAPNNEALDAFLAETSIDED